MLAISIVRKIVRNKFICASMSARSNAAISGCSHQSVNRVLSQFQKSGAQLSQINELDDDQLSAICYPDSRPCIAQKRVPDYPMIYRELHKRKGKTLIVMYLEYQAIEKRTAYGKSRFYALIRHYLKECKVCMKQIHVAGEEVQVDFAGTTLSWTHQGNCYKAHVFVACLGASKKIFAWATPGQTNRDWIAAINKMMVFYGGVTDVIVIDNDTGLVRKPGNPPLLNDNLEALASHYGCIVHTARVREAQDKGLVEQSVKFITDRILRTFKSNLRFYSLDEINQHLAFEVEKLNSLPLQKLGISRNALFDSIEKQELKPLPVTPFDIIVSHKHLKVPTEYHIHYQGHDYSVPYRLANKRVEVIVTGTHLKCYHKHRLQAEHRLSQEFGGTTTLASHRKPGHQAQAQYTQAYFVEWAHTVAPCVVEFIHLQYQLSRNKASTAIGSRCLALQKLCATHGQTLFVQAVQYALTHGYKNPTDIRLLVSAIQALGGVLSGHTTLMHENLRGSDYFSGGHHAQK